MSHRFVAWLAFGGFIWGCGIGCSADVPEGAAGSGGGDHEADLLELALGNIEIGDTFSASCTLEARERFSAGCEAHGGAVDDLCRCKLGCVAPQSVGPGRFDCGRLHACDAGEICALYFPDDIDVEGCTTETCVPVPASCTNEPSCDCVLPELTVFDLCETDGAGNITVSNTW